ncbi:MAG: glycosyltransferase family 4 protein [Pseudonocardiaceae bacterium]
MFLVKDLRVNGANRVILESATGLAELGWDVTLAVSDRRYHQWLGKPLRQLSAEEAHRQHFDMALSTFYTTMFDLDRVDCSVRWQYFQDNYYRYGTRTDERLDQIEYAYLHRNSGKFVVSHYLAGLLRAKGVSSTVVQPGVDTKQFFPEPVEPPRDHQRALVEGHCRSYKALPESYEAIPSTWEIWGLGLDDHRLGAIEMHVQVPQHDLRRIYGACDALVKLERGGGHPLPPLEAMACAVPVLVSDEGGHLDYCIEDYNALIASSPAHGRTLLAELASDQRLQRTLAENGLAVAKACTWDRMVTKLDRALRSES